MASSNKGLKTRKQQRLLVISAAVATLVGAVLLILFALGGDSLSLFLQPSDVREKQITAGQHFRLGGLVEEGSFTKADDGLTYHFKVTDCAATLPVQFKGLLPDLFREGQGVVTEGALNGDGVFVASTVLAKHDENYNPPGMLPKSADQCVHPGDAPYQASDQTTGH